MDLKLSDTECKTLLGILQDHLPQLRREFAGTDLPARELRQELEKRVRLCERLVSELGKSAAAG
jgi:hypothetical protein